MPWVDAEYAGELAVVSAWLAALVPWSVSFQPNAPFGSIYFAVRWPLWELQVRLPATVEGDPQPVIDALTQVYPGVRVFWDFYLADPLSAATFYDPGLLSAAGTAWVAGAAVVLVAVVLGMALYRDEAGVAARLPVDHVRLMAGLLGLATVAFAAATVLYWLGPAFVGLPIPVGVVVLAALAVVLARVERV